MISAVVLTKNEEKNIKNCLSSLLWCNEIVVVDDYSQDETIEKVKSQKPALNTIEGSRVKSLKIFKRHLNGDFAAQRNFGLSKAVGDWVLFVDADEIISEELAFEIQNKISKILLAQASKYQKHISKIQNNKKDGFLVRRKDYFLGKWLKYGETANVKLLRLAKKNIGCWQGRVHETWKIEGKVTDLENPLLHYPHQNISQFLKEINWYTDLVAQYWREQGRNIAFWVILLYPLGKFVQNYILRLGFLDGVPGLIMALMMSFHSFLVRSKLWLLEYKNK